MIAKPIFDCAIILLTVTVYNAINGLIASGTFTEESLEALETNPELISELGSGILLEIPFGIADAIVGIMFLVKLIKTLSFVKRLSIILPLDSYSDSFYKTQNSIDVEATIKEDEDNWMDDFK